jgi:hypothetical protein
MVKEIQYTSIRRVLDELTDHPMLTDLTLEQAVRYALKFISKHGYACLYQDKIEDVDIHDFRGVLPCDRISINQVREKKSGICLRSMTDTFYPPVGPRPHNEPPCPPNPYNPHRSSMVHPEFSFKTQNRIIYTSFPEGIVEISYKAIPVDEDGFPLLLQNESYLDALEAYISMKTLRNKFRQGKIAAAVYQDAQQEYAFAAATLQAEFNTPSISEMQSISNYMTSLIPRTMEFDKAFRDLGDREYIRRH